MNQSFDQLAHDTLQLLYRLEALQGPVLDVTVDVEGKELEDDAQVVTELEVVFKAYDAVRVG